MNRAVPVLVAGILGCVRQQPPPEPEEPFIFNTLGSSVHATSEGSSESIPPRPAAPPPELSALAQAIDGLRHGPAPTSDELARAVRALADALVLVEPSLRENIAAIHAVADRLADAPRHSRRQAQLVLVALDRTRTVLARSSPRNRWRLGEYATSVTRFTEHVTALDPDRPLRGQRWRVDAAFAAALATIEVAVGVAAR